MAWFQVHPHVIYPPNDPRDIRSGPQYDPLVDPATYLYGQRDSQAVWILSQLEYRMPVAFQCRFRQQLLLTAYVFMEQQGWQILEPYRNDRMLGHPASPSIPTRYSIFSANPRIGSVTNGNTPTSIEMRAYPSLTKETEQSFCDLIAAASKSPDLPDSSAVQRTSVNIENTVNAFNQPSHEHQIEKYVQDRSSTLSVHSDVALKDLSVASENLNQSVQELSSNTKSSFRPMDEQSSDDENQQVSLPDDDKTNMVTSQSNEPLHYSQSTPLPQPSASEVNESVGAEVDKQPPTYQSTFKPVYKDENNGEIDCGGDDPGNHKFQSHVSSSPPPPPSAAETLQHLVQDNTKSVQTDSIITSKDQSITGDSNNVRVQASSSQPPLPPPLDERVKAYYEANKQDSCPQQQQAVAPPVEPRQEYSSKSDQSDTTVQTNAFDLKCKTFVPRQQLNQSEIPEHTIVDTATTTESTANRDETMVNPCCEHYLGVKNISYNDGNVGRDGSHHDCNVGGRDGSNYNNDGNVGGRDGGTYNNDGNVGGRDGGTYNNDGNVGGRDGGNYNNDGNVGGRDGGNYNNDGYHFVHSSRRNYHPRPPPPSGSSLALLPQQPQQLRIAGGGGEQQQDYKSGGGGYSSRSDNTDYRYNNNDRRNSNDRSNSNNQSNVRNAAGYYGGGNGSYNDNRGQQDRNYQRQNRPTRGQFESLYNWPKNCPTWNTDGGGGGGSGGGTSGGGTSGGGTSGGGTSGGGSNR